MYQHSPAGLLLLGNSQRCNSLLELRSPSVYQRKTIVGFPVVSGLLARVFGFVSCALRWPGWPGRPGFDPSYEFGPSRNRRCWPTGVIVGRPSCSRSSWRFSSWRELSVSSFIGDRPMRAHRGVPLLRSCGPSESSRRAMFGLGVRMTFCILKFDKNRRNKFRNVCSQTTFATI